MYIYLLNEANSFGSKREESEKRVNSLSSSRCRSQSWSWRLGDRFPAAPIFSPGKIIPTKRRITISLMSGILPPLKRIIKLQNSFVLLAIISILLVLVFLIFRSQLLVAEQFQLQPEIRKLSFLNCTSWIIPS